MANPTIDSFQFGQFSSCQFSEFVLIVLSSTEIIKFLLDPSIRKIMLYDCSCNERSFASKAAKLDFITELPFTASHQVFQGRYCQACSQQVGMDECHHKSGNGFRDRINALALFKESPAASFPQIRCKFCLRELPGTFMEKNRFRL
jgi:hypothetical protein